MLLKKWEEIPREMQIEEVKRYYDLLNNRRVGLLLKRIFRYHCRYLSLVSKNLSRKNIAPRRILLLLRFF